MKTTTVNISFPTPLLHKIDAIANQEDRNRSDLLRTAVRAYIDRKKKWNILFETADRSSAQKAFTEKEIESEIHTYRKRKSGRNVAHRS